MKKKNHRSQQTTSSTDRTGLPQAGTGQAPRQRAEEIARETARQSPENIEGRSIEEIRQTLHELRVHQIELDIQNEELCRAQAEIEASHARYLDLYNLAPVGYVTLNEKGLILEANLTTATMLGVARSALINQPISRFIVKDDQDIYYGHRKKLLGTGEPQMCELRLLKKDKTAFRARLEATAAKDVEGAPVCLVVLIDFTGHKREDDELRRSGERYRTILEDMEEGYFEVNLAGNFTFVNDAECKNMGYSREELMRMHYREYTNEENAKKVFQAFSNLYKTGKPCTIFDYEVTKKNGTKAVSEMRVSLMKDSKGKPTGFRGIARHITERKDMEDELRRSGERYSTIMEDIDEGYFEEDLTGNFTFVNDAECRASGYSREELIGMNYREYTDEATAKNLYELFSNIYKAGKPVKGFPGQFISRDGTRHFNEISASLIRDVNGKPIGFRGISRDVTERKQMEEAVRHSEEKYRNIIEQMEDGYFETDLAGNFTFVNEAECRNLGYARGELIGMSSDQYADEKTIKALDRLLTEVYNTGVPVKAYDMELTKKDKTKSFNEISVSLIRNSQGNQTGYRGIARDITGRKRAEKKLQQSEEKFRNYIESAPDGVLITDDTGKFIEINKSGCRILGYSKEEIAKISINDLLAEESLADGLDHFKKVMATGAATADLWHKHKDGFKRCLTVEAVKLSETRVLGFTKDITERKHREAYGEMGREVLQILNEPGGVPDSIQRILAVLKTRTGFDAVGIRLQDGDDFPYFVQQGFADDFLLTENTLLECDGEGCACRNKDGNVRLECACGLVISGKTDPLSPLFTPGGSFWTNDSFTLLEIPIIDDPRLHPRNLCIHLGYASVALVPIRNKDGIVGLIQLNDRRKGCFIRETVELLEGIASHIGAALMRKRAEEELRKSEMSARTLIENSFDVIFTLDAEGTFLFVSPAWERHFGHPVSAVIGENFAPFVHPDDIGPCIDYLMAVLMTGQAKTSPEYRVRHADGSWRWFIANGSCYIDLNGQRQFMGTGRDITDRKNAEERIRWNESRLKTLVSILQYPAKTIQDFLDYALEQAIQLTGSKIGYIYHYYEDRKEFVLNTWSKEVMPECAIADPQRCYELDKTGIWGEAVRQRRPIIVNDYPAANLLKKGYPEGHVQLLKFITVPIFKGNSIVGVIGLANRETDYEETDVLQISLLMEAIWKSTERKRVEEALLENKRQYDLALRSARMGAWSLDIITDKRYFDEQVCHLLGIGPTTFNGTQEEFFDMVHSDDRDVIHEALSRTIEQNEMYEVEYRVVWSDRSIHHISARGMLLRDDAGRPVRINGIIWDITDRRQAEEKLREITGRLHLATVSAKAGVWDWNLQTSEMIWDDRMLELYGLTHENFPGGIEAWEQGLHPDDSSRAVEECQAALRGERDFDTEFRVLRPDGTVVHIKANGLVLRDMEGKPLRMIGLNTDITERRRAEDELREINRELKEATTRANEMAIQAEVASAAKSEFLANMSHEIRTPMNGVIGMTGLLLDTELNDEQRRYAEIVRTSGESLLGLVNNILDFSKIEAKKLDLETLDFDLTNLLEDFAAALAVRAYEKRLELLCAADPDVPTLLRGDPGRLRQILTNLAGNAVKFTPAGEVAIRVSLIEAYENDVLLRFSVRDTGIGIPRDKIGLLFNTFSQVDASTTRQYGGTGLGLAISKQLAGLMGGEVGAESEEGKGSEFWFTVHLDKQIEGTQVAIIPPADLSGVRVLIVDDNATSREILTRWLVSWGMRPQGVQDGTGAIQALYRAREENVPFRLAVIDMQMPGMDGATLGRAIKTDERLADTRMVMLTSLSLRGDARRFQEIGFAAYATKPIRHHEVKEILSLALTDRECADSTPRAIVTRHTVGETLNLFAGRKARILLAEDNITNQQVAQGILKKLGLRADAVANGAEAITALETLPYDLVLMDLQMPEMGGIEAALRIRGPESKVRNHHIPIIAMTAHALQGDRERCLEAGMNDYVAKPVSTRLLAEALDKWLPRENIAIRERPPCEDFGGSTVRSEAVGDKPEAPIFDKAGMLARLMDDEELARKLIDGFLDDIPKQIGALRGYLAAGDVPGAERQAHSIKGAAANVGGEALRAVAFEMEMAGKAGNLHVISARIAELEAQFERLKQATTKKLWATTKGEHYEDTHC
jgi:PAS domain S-box-containing protein